MIRLVLLRHASTEWNERGRIQGRADVPLSAEGRATAAGWRLPHPEAMRVSSPLTRARDTFQCMDMDGFEIESRLTEMDWGRWEGRRLADLRREFGAAMAENEARGLDFHPDGGESPRDVQKRVRPWLADIARRGHPIVAVTHKGVIRAIFALASGWDMTTVAPQRLRWDCAHLFTVGADGNAAVERLNFPLAVP